MFESAKNWIHIVNAGWSSWKAVAAERLATPGFTGEAPFATAAALRIATPGFTGTVEGAEVPERVWVSTPGFTGYLSQEEAEPCAAGDLCGAGA
ncbi:hypothetical protein HF878_05935 [Selenomonas bovis]|uniref:Uncharacterized protein n=1 Tax=Selenomonas bovis TaxID=416586 RepID=A0A848B4D5_9FIRM|nr:hypothetical protein [Selenomonas bovis]NMD99020.1 hypothetical protein [Selenomonas bovis]